MRRSALCSGIVTIHLALVRGRGGDGSSPVVFANQQDLGTSRPRPCRVRLGDLNSYEPGTDLPASA